MQFSGRRQRNIEDGDAEEEVEPPTAHVVMSRTHPMIEVSWSRFNFARSTAATGNAGKKEVIFQSPFLGLKDVLCKQVKETIKLKFNRYFTELDTTAEEYFNKMEAMVEGHHKGILDSVNI